MRVRYYGAFATNTGYGEAGHGYLAALQKAGVELEIVPLFEGDTDYLGSRYGHLNKLVVDLRDVRSKHQRPTHIIVHNNPWACCVMLKEKLLDIPEGAEKIALTTWETTRLKPEIAKSLSELYDLIVVPSEFNRKAFRISGVPEEKITVIPHCFDSEFWLEEPTTPWLLSDRYVFYSVLAWRELKNPLGLLTAYLTEFTSKDDVLLRVVTTHRGEEIEQLKQGLALDDYPLYSIVGWLPEELYRGLHYDSDCYVTPTRGEGWGLGAFEAAAVGNPVIATGWSGVKDYLDGYAGTRYLDYFLTPATTPLDHADPTGINGRQCIAEPNIEQLRYLMRQAYEECWGRVDGSNTWMDRFTQEVVGVQFKKVLEAGIEANS